MYGDSAYASQQELIASKAPATQDCTNQRVRKVGGVPHDKQRRSAMDSLQPAASTTAVNRTGAGPGLSQSPGSPMPV